MKTLFWHASAFAALLPALLAAQTGPFEVDPGVAIPNASTPWALDSFHNEKELVPIHHSNVDVNNHTGANTAGALAGSFFYKPKQTIELSGTHARTVLHSGSPVIYLRVDNDEDPAPDDATKGTTSDWTLVRAAATKKGRVFLENHYNQLSGKGTRRNDDVPIKLEKLDGGWIRITPEQALSPGEYGLLPLPKAAKYFPERIWDFTLDPAAPNDTDAVALQPRSAS